MKILFAVVFSIVAIGLIQYSYAYNIIEVIPSQACMTLIKHNMTSGCPTIKELAKWDNSNQHLSGKFIVLHNGQWVRQHPQVLNHWAWYKNQTVCVDCLLPLGSPDEFKTIIIEPRDFTYILQGTTVTNNTLASFHSRYMPDCFTATIAYSPALLNDTINYMKSNCTAKLLFHENSTINVPHSTALDYKSAYVYTLANWLKSNNNIHMQNCIIHKCVTKSLDRKW